MYKQRRKHDCTNDTKPKNKHVIIPINIEPEIISKKKNTPKIKYQHLIVIALILSCIVLFILFNINKTNQNYLDKVKNQQYPSMNETLTMVESQLNISKSINNREILSVGVSRYSYGIEQSKTAFEEHQQMIKKYHSFSLPPLYPNDLPKDIKLDKFVYNVEDEAGQNIAGYTDYSHYTDNSKGYNFQTNDNPIVYKAFGTLKVDDDGSEKSIYQRSLGIIPERVNIGGNGIVTKWPYSRVSDQPGIALSARIKALYEDQISSGIRIGMTTLVSINVTEYNEWAKTTRYHNQENGFPDLFVRNNHGGIHIISHPYQHPDEHANHYLGWQIPPSFITIIANVPNRAIPSIIATEQTTPLTPEKIKELRDQYCKKINEECRSNGLNSELGCCKEARWCNDDIGYEVETKEGFKDEPKVITSTTNYYDPIALASGTSARNWKKIEDDMDKFLVIHSSYGAEPIIRCTKLLTMEREINDRGLKSKIQYKIYHERGFENNQRPKGIFIYFYGGPEPKGEVGDRDFDLEQLNWASFIAARNDFIVYVVYPDLRGNIMDRVTDLAWFTYNLRQNADNVMWPFDLRPNELKIIGFGASHGGLTGALVVTEKFQFGTEIIGKDMFDAYILNAAYINPSKETCDIGGCAKSRIEGRYLEKFIGTGFGVYTNCRQIVNNIKWNQLSVEILNVHNLKDKNVSPRTMIEMLEGVFEADKWKLYNFIATSYIPEGDKAYDKSHFFDHQGFQLAFSWVNEWVVGNNKIERDEKYRNYLFGIYDILRIRYRYDPVYKWAEYPHINLFFYENPNRGTLQYVEGKHNLWVQSFHFLHNLYKQDAEYDACLTNIMENKKVRYQIDEWNKAAQSTKWKAGYVPWVQHFYNYCWETTIERIKLGETYNQFITSCAGSSPTDTVDRLWCFLTTTKLTSFSF